MQEKLRFKAAPLEIPESEPFKYDLLGRKESAEILTEFVGSLGEPFVLVINAPFGMGKTTFIKMWQHHLQNQGFPCLFFNAWENDFSDAPLVSLIGEIGAAIDTLTLDAQHKKLAHQIYNKAKKAGAALVKTALPVGLKLATAGLLDLSAVSETDIGKAVEDVAKKQIEKYQADKKSIANFRQELTKLVETLGQKRGVNGPKPVIFLIDELDRCRPPYAIELLEKIKHLFSVQGLVFVLAIHEGQLLESVKALYGAGMDAGGYLKRFIDLEYRMPEPDHKRFVEAQFSRFGIEDILKSKLGSERDFFYDALPTLFSVFQFSLRTQEQCFTHLAIILRTIHPGTVAVAYHLSLLLCLRTANAKLYTEYCTGYASPDEVITFLRSCPGGDSLMGSRLGQILRAHLIKGIRSEEKRQAALGEVQRLANSHVDRSGTDEARSFSNILEWVGRGLHDMTGYVHKKIEIAHRFVQPASNA